MKIITVIAQQVSPEALDAALPAEGIIALTITGTEPSSRTATSVGSYRGVKAAQHFTPNFRIELQVEDTAVEAVIDGIAFGRSAGLFGDARVRLSDGSADDEGFASTRSPAA